jgi:hypothetical protein
MELTAFTQQLGVLCMKSFETSLLTLLLVFQHALGNHC